MKGYSGRILHVDLSDEKIWTEDVPEQIYRKYLGGSCLGTYYVLKGIDPKADAFSESNVIALMISPTAGAKMAGSSRVSITAKSPLTNMIGAAESGGYAGAELRFCGFDGIVITGKAKSPKYLSITKAGAMLRDASAIWGKETGVAEDFMRAEIGETNARSILIGPAGENLIRYANVAVDLTHFAGRCGLGAVFGSKRLKGIILKGFQKPEFADEELLKQMQAKYVSTVKSPGFLKDLGATGTPILVEGCNAIGNLPTNNWSAGSFAHADEISGETLNKTHLKGRHTCWGCALSCKRVVEIREGDYTVDARYGGPEYETIGMCGSNLGIHDLAAICKIGELCNKYGMDTISFGGTIGFLMEAFEKGAITLKDTLGESVRFGDAKMVISLCEKTARREGLGDLIAEGTKRAADQLPPESSPYAVHVKGKEMPAHTPHAKPSFALAYSLVPYGPDHCSSEADGFIGNDPVSETALNYGLDQACETTDLNFEKVKLFRITQILYSIVDSMPICLFTFGTWTVFPFEYLVDYINACTGWKLSFYELLKIGERRINIMTAFNTLAGFNDKDNVLPAKFFEQMDDYGVLAKSKLDEDAWKQGKQDYYTLNCWTSEGIPSIAKMKELGLGWVLEKDTDGFFGKAT